MDGAGIPRLRCWGEAVTPFPHLPRVLMLLQDEKGAFNFDQETVINPETGEQVRAASAEPPWCWGAGLGWGGSCS